jgi:cellobiose-specific phosphotransferase system component IIB
MKKERVFSFAVCLLTLCMVTSVFASEIEEQAEIENLSSEIEAVSNSMAGDIQTTTRMLDGTAWEVDVISIPPTVTTTATLTISNGMLSISGWVVTLTPGAYEENVRGDKISFSATLTKKIGAQTILYEFQGSAKPDRRIFGLIHNLSTNINYIFFGEPLPASEE